MLMIEQAVSNLAPDTSAKDVYDDNEVKVNRAIIDRAELFNPLLELPHAKQTIQALAYMVSRLPTQSRRDVEQERFQAFSTPNHYAYAAAWAANLQPGDVVLEPSAGTGNLVAFALNAGVSEVHANEISPRRIRMLATLNEAIGFRFIQHEENAEHLHDILDPSVRPTAILMNPPFSATGGRLGDRAVADVAATHIRQALARLEAGGRLVAIVGRGMSFDAPSWRAWWNETRSAFTVRANVLVDGAEYSKFGTRFDTRLLVIDKCGPTVAQPLDSSVSAVVDILDILQPVRQTRLLQPRPDKPEVNEHAAPAVAKQPQPSVSAAAESNGPSTPQPPAVRAPRKRTSPERAATGRSLIGDMGPAAVLEPIDLATADQPISTGIYEQYRLRRMRVPKAIPHPSPLVESSAMSSVSLPPINYRFSLPDTLVSEGKVSDAQLEAVAYAGEAFSQDLPGNVRKGFFIGDGTGVGKGRELAAIIIDDFASRNGPRKAVWVTKNAKLLHDARRDWCDLGGNAEDIFSLSDYKLGERVPDLRQGICFVSYDTLKSQPPVAVEGPRKLKESDFENYSYSGDRRRLLTAANVPIGRNLRAAAFVTMLQGNCTGMNLKLAVKSIDSAAWPEDDDPDFQADRETILTAMGFNVESLTPPALNTAPKESRLDQLLAWMGQGFDGVIAFDESHIARNGLEDE